MRLEDLTDKQFGEWKVLEYAGDRKWFCECSCGTRKAIDTSSLKSGRSTKCNSTVHKRSGEKALKDVTNQQFGQLTVIKYVGQSRFLCRCTCGNELIRLRKNLGSHSKCKSCQKPTYKDVKEQRFGDWLAIEYLGDSIWKCRCLGCNKERNISITELESNTKYKCTHNKEYADAGDFKVLELNNGYAKVKCKCGYIKTISDSALYNYRKNKYKCNHAEVVNKRFGKLIVIGRKPNGICLCQCDCGNKKKVHIGNLLNKTTESCGCNKSALYNKEEVLKQIQCYTSQYGMYPTPKELASLLDIGMTTVYGYIHNYNLEKYISKSISVAEREIFNMFPTAIQHNRKILNGKELDLYIPEKKLAIEFNGNYWHSSLLKDKYYHQNKTIECAKQGIQLVHIFEYEWENSKTHDKIVNYLKRIKEDSQILYARQLSICEVTWEEAKEFEQKHHLQGEATSSINIGLRDNETLVGLMTFGKSRYDTKYEYEIIRLCFKDNTSIVGGTERMFRYFLDNYNPSSIITYVNISKFTGNIYTRLGFKPIQSNPITKPNYVWVEGHTNEVLSRYQTQKHKLLQQGLGDETETEDEIMSRLGYCKVYDSGNLKLEYK